jgi:hypothetical protein
MHIVVCIKQIIDPEIPPAEFRIDFEARKAVEDQGKRVLNPYDGNALEVALQLKDRHKETKVTVMTMGAESDQKVLRHALAMVTMRSGCGTTVLTTWIHMARQRFLPAGFKKPECRISFFAGARPVIWIWDRSAYGSAKRLACHVFL